MYSPRPVLTRYFVWRRGDGYVGWTTYAPHNRPELGPLETFEPLLGTKDWKAALSRINAERVAQAINAQWWPVPDWMLVGVSEELLVPLTATKNSARLTGDERE
jgi:hypothetical protein